VNRTAPESFPTLGAQQKSAPASAQTDPRRDQPRGADVSNLSKSMRFEILRRDNFSCTYCGAKAPDAELHVDHVLPTALGGSSEPNNLTTACQECNSGKGSKVPDGPMVAEVEAKNLRWRAAVALAAQESTQRPPEVTKAIEGIIDLWSGINILTTQQCNIVEKYVMDGLPAETMIDCAEIALTSMHVKVSGMFPYMIGVARKKLAAIHERAQEIIAEQDGE